MTDKEKLDKLVAEIKRRYKECKGATPATEYQELLDFIDSMQEEPTDIPADAVLDSNKDGLIADTILSKKIKKIKLWKK